MPKGSVECPWIEFLAGGMISPPTCPSTSGVGGGILKDALNLVFVCFCCCCFVFFVCFFVFFLPLN